MVWILEEGRRRYGVGITSPVCVLLDRGGNIIKNGNLKVDMLDMKAVPSLVELFRNLYGVLMVICLCLCLNSVDFTHH